MSEAQGLLRYARGSLLGDYARSGIGLALTGVPLLAVEASLTMTVILGGLAALFAVFGVKTALRQRSQVILDERGVELRSVVSRRIDWAELTGFKLSYFATRRDRQAGWMQLTLAGPAGKMRLDSTLDQFGLVVERAVQAAVARGLTVSPSTRANLAFMNVALPEPEA